MSRAIDADRLLTDRMKEHYYHLPNGDIAIPIIDIEHAPTITPERKRGRWIADNRNYFVPHFRCSSCGILQRVETVMYKPAWKYCPRCGAEMMEEEQ